uniref:Uncharacterized protein n=1 Tax=Arundo donax TaxID=35708 RepID=A0A0A9HYS3_ARUDO
MPALSLCHDRQLRTATPAISQGTPYTYTLLNLFPSLLCCHDHEIKSKRTVFCPVV